MKVPIAYQPLKGKTYSLFGKNDSTDEYYNLIHELVNLVLDKTNDPKLVLQTIQDCSRNKRLIRKIALSRRNNSLISSIICQIDQALHEFTSLVEIHLKTLPISKIWDRRLSTTREQYHLYMFEIELTNRMYAKKFIGADHKMALLPHCLRDFKIECKSHPDEFDYQCGHCSKNCYQNYVSRLLKENQVEPYIWMGADIKKKAKEIYKNKQTLGIFGIACIPELVWGLRKCQKIGIPAIGIPLDANRCQRWMGKFHENSINLGQLELLLNSSLSE